jgi:hypothetical protein
VTEDKSRARLDDGMQVDTCRTLRSVDLDDHLMADIADLDPSLRLPKIAATRSVKMPIGGSAGADRPVAPDLARRSTRRFGSQRFGAAAVLGVWAGPFDATDRVDVTGHVTMYSTTACQSSTALESSQMRPVTAPKSPGRGN